jgi:centrosomal protein CEP104
LEVAVLLLAARRLNPPYAPSHFPLSLPPFPLLSFPRSLTGQGPGVNDLAVDMGMDADTAAMLREVAGRKEAAVADEDFELAKRLKALQDQIRHVGGTLAGLAADKARAIAEEDYDAAARLKDEINRIRSVIVIQMAELGMRPNLPGGGGGAGGGGGGPLGVGMGGPLGVSAGMGMGGLGAAAGHDRMSMMMAPPVAPAPVGMGMGAGSGYDGYGSGAGGPGPSSMPHANHPGGGVGSADRPIRPAHNADIYARAVSSPDRDGGGYDGPGGAARSPGGPRALAFDGMGGAGRPISRQLRPARENNVEIALEAEAGGQEPAGTSPFARRRDAPVAEERPDPSQLAGVDGASDLPAPEPLSAALEKDSAPLIDIFGEYVVRCFYSREWHLREAALLKMAHEVNGGRASGPHTFSSCAGVLSTVMARDRITNVFIAASSKLLPALLSVYAGHGPEAVRRPELATVLEPVVAGLMEKLGDNTPKVRETAMAAIVEVRRMNAWTMMAHGEMGREVHSPPASRIASPRVPSTSLLSLFHLLRSSLLPRSSAPFTSRTASCSASRPRSRRPTSAASSPASRRSPCSSRAAASSTPALA